jgi:hypothetical protein
MQPQIRRRHDRAPHYPADRQRERKRLDDLGQRLTIRTRDASPVTKGIGKAVVNHFKAPSLDVGAMMTGIL